MSTTRITGKQWIEEVIMRPYFKDVTVEEKVGDNVVSREIRFCVYSVLEWFDDLGIFHQLNLFASDLNWLSEMHICIGE